MRFLDAVGDAANAIAELNGGPLAERRLLNDFPARALASEHPEFTANLFNLLGANQVDASAAGQLVGTMEERIPGGL